MTLRSIVTEHLYLQRKATPANPPTGIAVVYLKYNEPEQNLNTVLGTIIRQLLHDHESIPDVLQEIYENQDDPNAAPSLKKLSRILLEMCETCYSTVFLIIDALDECEDKFRWELLDILRPLPNSRLMITSRLLPGIEEELEGFSRLDVKANKADIELFINRQIENNKNLKKIVSQHPAMRRDIHVAVVKTAQDM